MRRFTAGRGMMAARGPIPRPLDLGHARAGRPGDRRCPVARAGVHHHDDLVDDRPSALDARAQERRLVARHDAEGEGRRDHSVGRARRRRGIGLRFRGRRTRFTPGRVPRTREPGRRRLLREAGSSDSPQVIEMGPFNDNDLVVIRFFFLLFAM
jgi:hypothetical protein